MAPGQGCDFGGEIRLAVTSQPHKSVVPSVLPRMAGCVRRANLWLTDGQDSASVADLDVLVVNGSA